MRTQLTRGLAFLLLVLPLGGCGAAALAGAGAATGVYLTSRGAAGVVEGTVADLDRRTGTVLAAQNIDVRERKIAKDRTKIEIKGETAEGDAVKVKIQRKSPTTSEIKVEVKKDPVAWDQDRARAIVQQIVSTN